MQQVISNTEIQVIVLAGGLGTRMAAISGNLPKALLEVGHSKRTFIDVQAEWLKLMGADSVIYALGHKGNLIESHLKDAYKKNASRYPSFQFVYDGPTLQGTGGAIRAALPFLNDNFIVTYGDSFLPFSITNLFRFHERAHFGITLAILHNSNRGDTSNVLFRDGSILEYNKSKPNSGMEHIDYGVMAIRKKHFMTFAPQTGKFDLSQYMSETVRCGQSQAQEASHPFFEVGSPSGYQFFCETIDQFGGDLLRMKRDLHL